MVVVAASGMYLFDGFFWIMQWLVAAVGSPKLSLVGDVGLWTAMVVVVVVAVSLLG